MFFVYVLRSHPTGRTYIGHTDNLDRRTTEHNTDKSVATKQREPWELVGRLPRESRSEAMKLEAKLKRMKRSDLVIAYLRRHSALV
ncbi:MAG: GIY-YIG nuclease family protein [Candidatus Neomarinimicrobiota bacterium]